MSIRPVKCFSFSVTFNKLDTDTYPYNLSGFLLGILFQYGSIEMATRNITITIVRFYL